RLIAEAGVAFPRGFEDLHSVDDVVSAARKLADATPPVKEAVLKLNEGVGGYGNALVDIAATAEGGMKASLANSTVEGLPASYLDALAQGGGIIEERVVGEDFRSPSVQLRIAPGGDVELLSTHDQILGGPSGQEYYGASFPADPGYAKELGDAGLKIGRLLAREGVLGRFAVDFVVTRNGGSWDTRAIEINLRKGGTTHPFLTLQLLTGGHYDAESAGFHTPTGPKYYLATDHLMDDRLARLTPDDLLDIVAADPVSWDETRQTGVVWHMISALPVVGRVGLTAIGASLEDARELHDRAAALLLTSS
ncbi:MAG TPA: peptide ligase PGM1-related protein, partial [Actinomycetota bacterium]|nr:peptide ligase PGM1-related protein [Actinomycetota bacterium]